MARSRNIKPSFFLNHILAKLPMSARVLFIGLWTIADREGRLEDVPEKIKVQILPYDDCDLNKLLNSLHSSGFIIRYEVENNNYIQIVNFEKHQNPHMKEAASSIPAPDLHGASIGNSGTSRADSLNPLTDSLNPSLASQAEAKKTKKPKSEKGTRLKDFLETAGEQQTATEWGNWSLGIGMDELAINQQMAMFCDYWNAQPGQKGVKLDWPATWRNWCRRAHNQQQQQEKRDAVFQSRFRK